MDKKIAADRIGADQETRGLEIARNEAIKSAEIASRQVVETVRIAEDRKIAGERIARDEEVRTLEIARNRAVDTAEIAARETVEASRIAQEKKVAADRIAAEQATRALEMRAKRRSRTPKSGGARRSRWCGSPPSLHSSANGSKSSKTRDVLDVERRKVIEIAEQERSIEVAAKLTVRADAIAR